MFMLVVLAMGRSLEDTPGPGPRTFLVESSRTPRICPVHPTPFLAFGVVSARRQLSGILRAMFAACLQRIDECQ